MSEIFGTFVFEGQFYKAGYRYGGTLYHQGGYDKCLRIYHDVHNQFIYSHDIFGDDKFEVESAMIDEKKVILTMRIPLCHKDKFDPTASKIITLKRIYTHSD